MSGECDKCGNHTLECTCKMTPSEALDELVKLSEEMGLYDMKDNPLKKEQEELIEYVMENANKCYADDFPINKIEDWIREFFDSYHPERSKRNEI